MTTSRPSGAITKSPTRSWRSWVDSSPSLFPAGRGTRRSGRIAAAAKLDKPPQPLPRPGERNIMIILGLDPGLGTTGWGLIAADGNRLTHIANGQIKTDSDMALASRLLVLDLALTDLILEHQPNGAAVEEVFLNVNPQSTLTQIGRAHV